MSDVFGQDAIALINKRIAVRAYSKQRAEKAKIEALSEFILKNAGNPFGASVRLAIMEGEETPRLGTYGLIKGARDFIAGCVKKGGRDIEGFGYEFERAVLCATALGFGTCWIGGIFTRGSFSKALNLKGDELLPAVCPFGFSAEKKSLKEKAAAAENGSRRRFAFEELFFDGVWGKPFKEEGDLKTCLEMVRIAPSASNKQPWRAIVTDKGINFYQNTDKKYAGNTMFGFCMQRIDMGIAACHFEFAARELGLPGSIVFDDPKIDLGSEAGDAVSYSFTWR